MRTKEEVEKIEAISQSGFNCAIDLVLNLLDNYDSNELAKFTVWDFIEKFREDLLFEISLHKRNL